jgi:hypothetical protein
VDVQQTWVDLADAVERDEWGEAAELADDLMEWLAKGGSPPTITGKPKFDVVIAKAACDCLCAWDV